MPQNLIDGGTYDASIVVPVDGEPRNASGLRIPFQSLANRTSYLKNLIGAASGLATLDGSSKVTAAQLPNRIVSFNEDAHTGATDITTASTSFVDALSGTTHPQLSIASTLAGDILDLAASFNYLVTGTGSGYWQLVVVDGAATDVVPGIQLSATGTYGVGAGGGQQSVAARGKYTVVTGGTLTVKLQHKVSVGTATSTVREKSSLFAVLYRP